MKWNFLPRPGGMSEQDPQLLEYFDIIWSEQAKEEKKRNDEREKKSRTPAAGGIKKPGGKGRRR